MSCALDMIRGSPLVEESDCFPEVKKYGFILILCIFFSLKMAEMRCFWQTNDDGCMTTIADEHTRMAIFRCAKVETAIDWSGSQTWPRQRPLATSNNGDSEKKWFKKSTNLNNGGFPANLGCFFHGNLDGGSYSSMPTMLDKTCKVHQPFDNPLGIDPPENDPFLPSKNGKKKPRTHRTRDLGDLRKIHGAARCRYIPYSRAKMMGDASYRFPEYFYRRWEVGIRMWWFGCGGIRRDSDRWVLRNLGPQRQLGSSPHRNPWGTGKSSSHALLCKASTRFE